MDSTIFDTLENRFKSGNSVPVERAHVNADEWQLLKVFRDDCYAKIEELERLFKRQANAALTGMDAAKRSAHIMEEHAKELYAASSPEALESERAMNEQLTYEIECLERDVSMLRGLLKEMQESGCNK